MRYIEIEAWRYDLVGNRKDGYLVNDQIYVGSTIIEQAVWYAQNEYFTKKLKQEIKRIFDLKPTIRFKNIKLQYSGPYIYIDHEVDEGNTPIGQLRCVRELTEEEQEAAA